MRGDMDAFGQDDFPRDWELVWLFESEPQVEFPNLDWFYNDLTFVTERGGDGVECYLLDEHGERVEAGVAPEIQPPTTQIQTNMQHTIRASLTVALR